MIPQEFMEVPEIAGALDALKETSYNLEELQQYERYWDVLRTQQTMINDAMRKGKMEGELIGEPKGELKKAKETALKMIYRGFTNEDIHDFTGLDLEIIEELGETMN